MKSASASPEETAERTEHLGKTDGSSTVRQNSLCADNQRYTRYIREKTNQLLQVMGTDPLRPEEFDDNELLSLDPIGIIVGSFEQVLEYLQETIVELREAKDELQAIFDATGVGISIIDRRFSIVKCNEKQRQLLVDSELKDVNGRFCYDVYCNRNAPGIDCPAVRTFTTGRPVMVREVNKKGKFFQLITTPFSRDESGQVTRVIEVSLDITEKKQAELEERRQREYYLSEKLKLATVLRSLSEGLLITDLKNDIVSVNPAALRMTGKREEELIGTNIHDLFGPACKEIGHVSASLAEGFHNREITCRHDGEERILAINSVALKDPTEETIGSILTFRDITEEKKHREAYLRAEKLAAVGQLSAGLAHELNTPLGTILGYARLLRKQDNLTSEQKDRLGLIADQARKSSTIIQDLLNYARSSAPVSTMSRQCDPCQVIGKTLHILAARIRKQQVDIDCHLVEGTSVCIDEKHLEQVLLNMLLNSLQALKGSGGKIEISMVVRDSHLQITIADNGPGIPLNIQSRVFDPFFTTKEVGEGTGLGLSICAGMISEVDGAIDLFSEPGKGAVFTIILPTGNCT